MVLFANELIQSYGGIIIVILIIVIGFLSYQMYRDRNETQTGKKLTANVVKVLKKNNCKVKGSQVTCPGAPFAGLGQKFTVKEAVDKVIDLISTEMGPGGAPPMTPARGPPPRIPQPSQAGPPGAPGSMPFQPPPTGGQPVRQGPPEPLVTNPKRAADMGGAPMTMGGAAAAAPGGGFGGLMSADGEPLGASLAGSDQPSMYTAGGGMMYNAEMGR